MKKLVKISSALALLAITVFSNSLMAQDATKELEGFTKKFEAAYNKQDDKTLKTYYTTNAERTNQQGETISGNENIIAEFITQWKDSKIMIKIKQDKAESQADGTVIATGTYLITGSTKAGEKIDYSGGYTNTVVKEGGHWKISKSVLSNL